MKKLLFIFFILFLTSCSPQMHINGVVVRKYNTSQNRYSPQRPYVGEPGKHRMYSSWGRFWFFRR